MAELLWSLLCEKVIVDSASNQVSIIGIVDQLNVPSVPTVVPVRFFLASSWERTEPSEQNFKFHLKIVQGASSYVLGDKEFEVAFVKERLRTFTAISGIKVVGYEPLNLGIETWDGSHWIGRGQQNIIVRDMADIHR